MKFTVSGRQYEIELDPATLMGDELLAVEDHARMDLQEWAQKLATGQFGFRDILLITFLADRRTGGVLPWEQFVKTIAPLTFRVVDDDPAVTPPVSEVAAALRAAVETPDKTDEPETPDEPPAEAVKKPARRRKADTPA